MEDWMVLAIRVSLYFTLGIGQVMISVTWEMKRRYAPSGLYNPEMRVSLCRLRNLSATSGIASFMGTGLALIWPSLCWVVMAGMAFHVYLLWKYVAWMPTLQADLRAATKEE